MTRTLALLTLALLAACTPEDDDRIRAGGVSMTVPPLLHRAQAFDGFTFAAGGWRLAWGEPDAGPGTSRLAVQGFSGSGDGRLLEGGVRIGDSDDPVSVGNCLTWGLTDGDPRPLPDRSIGGITFKATRNGDAGMSQQLSTTSYRAVVEGRCVAIDRYTYASPRDIPEGAPNREDVEGALDEALSSIRFD